jgi:hypothetical protein
MSDIVTYRYHRFDALHGLLTGAATAPAAQIPPKADARPRRLFRLFHRHS